MKTAINAKRLRHELISCGLKQKDLANAVGVSVASICRYLNGKQMPTCDTLIKIANALHVTPESLVDGSQVNTSDVRPFINVRSSIVKCGEEWTYEQKKELIELLVEAIHEDAKKMEPEC